MWRPIATIIAAISLSQPTMAPSRKRLYAETIQTQANKRFIDPFTLVAIFHNESRMVSGLVGGRNNQCIGLGQHCLFNWSYCRENYQSPRCLQKKAELLDPVVNIIETAQHISEWRRLCRYKTGRAELQHWLQGYQGYTRPGQGIWCGQKKVKGQWKDVRLPTQTRQVMRYRWGLIQRYAKAH